MISFEMKYLKFFKILEINLAEAPFDVKGYDAVFFRQCLHQADLPGFEFWNVPDTVIDLTQPWRRYLAGSTRR